MVEMRPGFETEWLAKYAGERAKGMFENIIPGKHIQIVVANDTETKKSGNQVETKRYGW